jgi:hypothetical protein
MDWSWSAGVLSVVAPSNPGQFYSKAGVETGARMTAVDLSGKSYIVLRNIQASGANAARRNLSSRRRVLPDEL